MAYKLINVKTKEVSHVDRGANNKRYFLIKRGNEMTEEALKKMAEIELSKDAQEAIKGVKNSDGVEAIVKVLLSCGDISTEDLGKIAKAAGVDLPEQKVDIDALVAKKIADDKAEAERLEKAKAGEVDLKKMELPPEVTVLLETLTKNQEIQKAEADKTKDELKKANEKIEKAEAVALRKAAIAKAESFKEAGTVEEIADILLALPEAEREKAEGIFKAASARIKAGDIFKEIGSDLDGGACGEMEKALAVIKKAHPNMTHAAAYEKTLEDNPKLAAQALLN